MNHQYLLGLPATRPLQKGYPGIWYGACVLSTKSTWAGGKVQYEQGEGFQRDFGLAQIPPHCVGRLIVCRARKKTFAGRSRAQRSPVAKPPLTEESLLTGEGQGN